MTNADYCPFCSQATEGTLKDGSMGHYQFDCPTCGPFNIYSATYRRFREGEFNVQKPEVLRFIQNTPADRIAYIGQRREGDNLKALYCQYRPR